MCEDMLYEMHLQLASLHKRHKRAMVNPFHTGLRARCLHSLYAFPPRRSQRVSVVLCWKDYEPPPFENSPGSLEQHSSSHSGGRI